MKKSTVIFIIIEILLFLALAASMWMLISSFQLASSAKYHINRFEMGPQNEWTQEMIAMLSHDWHHGIIYGSVSIFPAIADIAAMTLIAVKKFPVFKPLKDKIATRHVARKETRTAAKAAKAEAEKQKRIEELEAELHSLKKE